MYHMIYLSAIIHSLSMSTLCLVKLSLRFYEKNARDHFSIELMQYLIQYLHLTHNEMDHNVQSRITIFLSLIYR